MPLLLHLFSHLLRLSGEKELSEQIMILIPCFENHLIQVRVKAFSGQTVKEIAVIALRNLGRNEEFQSLVLSNRHNPSS